MKTTNKQVVHLENRSGHIYFRPTEKPDRTGDYDITITTKHYKVLVSGTVWETLYGSLHRYRHILDHERNS